MPTARDYRQWSGLLSATLDKQIMKKALVVFGLAWTLTAAVFAQTALDPSRLAVGGRIIGLGRTFIGLSDDVNSMFLNPAGLAALPRWQVTSMSGKFAEEYDYILLNGAYPTDIGTFGLGFVGASTGGVPVAKILPGTEADPIYVVDTSQPSISYQNNVIFLSYARTMPRLFNWEVPGGLNAGLNFKVFNTSLAGGGITDGVGTGTDLDAGIKLRPKPWLSLGASARNLLPASMGGKLTFSSGYTESYPLVYGLGGALNLLGPKDTSLIQIYNQKLVLLLDTEQNPSSPMLLHLGAEWTPYPIVSLRFGLDQDATIDQAGNQTVSSGAAYGLGLNYGGFRFDYAFHQFPGLPGVDNNYFSFSYGFTDLPKLVPKIKVALISPPDKSLTFEAASNLVGEIIDERIDFIAVNGQKTKFDLKGHFESAVNLKEGKNGIVIEGRSGKDLIDSQKVRVLRLKKFPDVGIDYWVAEPISLLAMSSIITGYPDGTFRPEGNITRAEMCTLLMKTLPVSSVEVIASSGGPAFKDVNDKHWAASYIARAADSGIVKGYPDGSFRPNGRITRAEGLAMVSRFAQVEEWAYADEFPDIAEKHWAATIIAGSKKAGLLKYLEGKKFDPSRLLSRAETVEMLQRTATVKDVLAKDLLNWESY